MCAACVMPDQPSLDAIPTAGHAVLLFDGVCLLCNSFVHFVIDHDPNARFQASAHTCVLLPPLLV